MDIEFINLDNKDNVKLIKDILLYPLKVNKDASGTLVETLRKDWPQIYGGKREFFMQYYSVTPSGLARDESVWHYHPTIQEDRFIVIKGEIVVAVADNREESQTKGFLNLFHMQSASPYILLIPKQTLHGFLVVSQEDAILLNFPTALYNSKEEGRIPYEEAKVKFNDGLPFDWNKVREEFLQNFNG